MPNRTLSGDPPCKQLEPSADPACLPTNQPASRPSIHGERKMCHRTMRLPLLDPIVDFPERGWAGGAMFVEIPIEQRIV